MSWIGLIDQFDLRAPSTAPNVPQDPPPPGGVLVASGAVTFEMSTSADWHIPCKLVEYDRFDQWDRRFTVYLNADYSLSVENRQGCATSYVRLSDIRTAARDDLRITYSWDAPARQGLLTAENLATGTIRQAVFANPIPMPREDFLALTRPGEALQIDPRIAYLATADHVAPVGPVATISAGAMVLTTQGPRPIERLRLGDMIVTQTGGPRPVRWLLKQDLPSRGSCAPVRLRAPYFGLERDITVAATQRVVISGIDTQYHFGKDAVLAQAGNLPAHQAVQPAADEPFATFYQVLLDSHECINLSGAWVDSLYTGLLAQSPDVAATTGLAAIPAPIFPVHRRPAHPVLRSYETRALADILSA